MKNRILQVNLSNRGGAFSLVFQVQKELEDKYVFDYFSQNRFINNSIYESIIKNGGRIFDDVDSRNKICKQINTSKQFYKFLIDNNYKIIHIHSDTSWKAAIYVIAARKANIQNIIVHSHSSGINGSFKLINKFLHLLLKRYVTSKSTIRCACSKESGEWMFNSLSDLEVVQNGVCVEKYQYNENVRKKIRSIYGIQENTIVVGTVGDFSWAKNPIFIFDLFKSLADDGKFFFLLIGDGPGKKNLENKFYELSDEQDVKTKFVFTGQVDNAQDYLSAMDVFILPSNFEGVPMSALEAQVNGLSVLTSDKVDVITNCSNYYKSLPLNVGLWAHELNAIDIKKERKHHQNFITNNRISIIESTKNFDEIYSRLIDD